MNCIRKSYFLAALIFSCITCLLIIMKIQRQIAGVEIAIEVSGAERQFCEDFSFQCPGFFPEPANAFLMFRQLAVLFQDIFQAFIQTDDPFVQHPLVGIVDNLRCANGYRLRIFIQPDMLPHEIADRRIAVFGQELVHSAIHVRAHTPY